MLSVVIFNLEIGGYCRIGSASCGGVFKGLSLVNSTASFGAALSLFQSSLAVLIFRLVSIYSRVLLSSLSIPSQLAFL